MSKFWLFQAVPQCFDFDSFLDTKPVECEWLATQYSSDMRIGDDVFLARQRN